MYEPYMEAVKNWYIQMLREELKEAKQTRSNEHIWEMGHDAYLPKGEINPHTQNIANLEAYIEILEEKLEEVTK